MNSQAYFSGLIDRIVLYAVSAIIQPYDGGDYRQKLQNITDINLCKKVLHRCTLLRSKFIIIYYVKSKDNHKICVHAVVHLLERYVLDSFEWTIRILEFLEKMISTDINVPKLYQYIFVILLGIMWFMKLIS